MFCRHGKITDAAAFGCRGTGSDCSGGAVEVVKPEETEDVGIELVEEPADLDDFVFVQIRLLQ